MSRAGRKDKMKNKPALNGVGSMPLLSKELSSLNKSNREMRKYLAELTVAVRKSIDTIDMIMKGPSTVERGKRIAVVFNYLEMANDRARYFGLGIDYRKDKKRE